eukprot:4081452-Karenia_brevis.AAC.1
MAALKLVTAEPKSTGERPCCGKGPPAARSPSKSADVAWPALSTTMNLLTASCGTDKHVWDPASKSSGDAWPAVSNTSNSV